MTRSPEMSRFDRLSIKIRLLGRTDDAASPTSSKTQKLFEGQDASQGKDLISTLPDDILVRILSFLTTEEAIRTSILSQRWRYMWLSIPNLYFSDPASSTNDKSDDQILELEDTFFGSIERALTLRNASCLRDLFLWLRYLRMQLDASQLQSWLSAAVKHNVQELLLSLPKQGEFVLPNSLFTSKSLTALCLTMKCTLKVPSFICFSSLTLLYIGDVVFQDDHSAQQLFSGCPILEELRLCCCDWRNVTVITIDNPTLRSLTFSDPIQADHFFSSKIMISALNLETLSVTGCLTVELLPCNVPSLNSASIEVYKPNDGEDNIQQIVKLLSGLQNVKSLDVSNETLESLFFAEDLQGHLPTFYNLTHLKAFVQGDPYYFSDSTSGLLVYILQKSPNLECLEIPRVFKRWEQYMIYESVPTCFHSSLKEFIIYDIHGEEDEVRLLRYLYENAPLLKRLGVECATTFSEELEKQEEIRRHLQQLRGASSSSCAIDFFSYKFPY